MSVTDKNFKLQLIVLIVSCITIPACAGTANKSKLATQVEDFANSVNMDSMKLNISIGNSVLTATLIDNETTRDFIKLLPLNLKMSDLFGREKYASLPKTISTVGKKAFQYQVGQIGYWSPGNEVAIFYRDDGQSIPGPGIIIIGRIESGVEVFNVPGSVDVKIELTKG